MKKIGEIQDRLVPFLFLIYSALLCSILIWRLPPFMGPDELNHLKRANLIAQGTLMGSRQIHDGKLEAGGLAEPTMDEAEAPFEKLKFHPEVKLGQVDASSITGLEWGSDKTWQSFDNTASYPPLFYFPAAAALFATKAIHSTVLVSELGSRIADSLAFSLLGFAALLIAGRARYYLFTLLLLPMSTMLASTVSQDGMLIATSVLACALMTRDKPLGKIEFGVLACSLSAMGIAKLPYIWLGLLLLFVNLERPRWKVPVTVLTVCLVALWNLAVVKWVQVPMTRPDVALDGSGQFHFLLNHPLAPISILFHTARISGTEYLAQTIGVLGWLDTPLPKLFYGLAVAALVGSFALLWPLNPSVSKSRPGWILATLMAGTFTVFLALYLAYTPVGLNHVEGIQGRYFLPILALLPVALPATPRLLGERQSTKNQMLTLAATLFPVVSAVVVITTLNHRYH